MTKDAHTPRMRAQARIIAPVADLLRKAGWVSVAAGLIWPLQAALIAWAVSQWVAGPVRLDLSVMAALGVAALGIVRAELERLAGGWLFAAADETIRRERDALILREARAPGADSSAAVAALAVQKLPLLQPWITRYHVAMTRVRVVPLVLLALVFSLSWVAGLVLLVAGPLIPVFMALVGMAAEDASRRQMDEIAGINDLTLERLTAMLDIRLLGAQRRVIDGFALRADDLRDRTMAVLRVAFLSSTVLELFAALGVALVAVFVGFTLLGEIGFGSWAQPLTLGEGLFILLIAPEFFQPLRELAAAWHDRAAGFAVVEELDRLDAAPRAVMLGQGARVQPLPGPLSIRTNGAGVAYAGTQIAVPDLSVQAGDALVLTGPSGAGKSTVLSALAGLVPCAQGQIEVCGQPLTTDSADAWRARIALVPQRPHFADVPLCAWLDPRGTGMDPAEALALAGATQIVARLPQGLKTRLGESGGGVSGGEARRLMIARAVMMGGDVLLADEPTADLDPETATHIIDALKRLNEAGRTLICASHDPALIAAFDTRVEVGA
ncbi:ATP-binding cassette domain-containing protein [Aliishimia ponticola]|uniref:ATP-binding cassette domain-containing protein n=1 Tax=Aliishimia ponticola TaxID=2499833 RepID=A0A4S4NJL6_9RHOB|nr:ATP-binding cassette domain-containing protein [Aliishimia ponticola]THH38458.1 ATP-binding cassette domain-containing protein [Aliishimia ponticola]